MVLSGKEIKCLLSFVILIVKVNLYSRIKVSSNPYEFLNPLEVEVDAV